MKKRILSIVLVLVMLVGILPTAAFAANESDSVFKYTYEAGNGATASKLSHPQVAPNTGFGSKYNDGVIDYVGDSLFSDEVSSDGESGARGLSYSWSALGYGDWIYTGLLYNAMGNTITQMPNMEGVPGFDTETVNSVLNVLFKGDFFVKEADDGQPGGALVKINVKTGEVVMLMSRSMDDSVVKKSCFFRNAVKYNNKLYFCGSVNGLPQIWQVDPENGDECKLVYGMTKDDAIAGYQNKISTGIRGMCVYDDKLVISCVMTNEATGEIEPQIAISSNPDQGFTVIATQSDLFNYPAYHYTDSIYGGSIWEIVEFNDDLYVSICTGTSDSVTTVERMQSFAIVRGEEQPDGTWKWTPVVGNKKDGAKYTFGIDPERTCAGAGVLMVYNDYLYIGEYNDEEIALIQTMFNLDLSFMNENLKQSVGLYRMDKNENIELVVGDATEMFPNGGISGIGTGFGQNENQYIWRMAVSDGKLYVGTFDTSSLLEPIGQFSNGDLFKWRYDDWKQLFTYIKELLKLTAGNNDENTVLSESEQRREGLRTLFEKEDVDYLAQLFTKLDASCFSDIAAVGLSDPILANLERLTADSASAASVNSSDDDTDANFNSSLFRRLTERMLQRWNSLKELAAQIRNVISIAKEVTVTASYMAKAERGFDLYVTDDGVNFDTMTINGFGDPYNHGLRVFAETDSGLGIGTANPFYGTQWWYINKISGGDSTPITMVDVSSDSYFYDAVVWALGKGVTKGIDLTHFAPNLGCTRAQVVTFLWRTAGEPDVNANINFVDVSESSVYYKAIKWAVVEGITKGTDAAHFSPSATCTRGQVAAFLYRAAGEPSVSGAVGFSDVASGSYCYDAVQWAVANGITKGTDATHYSPSATCTRGQVVTFLYRAQ